MSTWIYSGRLLRSLVRYPNKITRKLQELISRTKKGFNRRKRVVKTKKRQLALIECKINDILHKQTNHIVSTLLAVEVQTVVIGDVRDIRNRHCKHSLLVVRYRSHLQCSHSWSLVQSMSKKNSPATSYGESSIISI